jgi:hypothetical protein
VAIARATGGAANVRRASSLEPETPKQSEENIKRLRAKHALPLSLDLIDVSDDSQVDVVAYPASER